MNRDANPVTDHPDSVYWQRRPRMKNWSIHPCDSSACSTAVFILLFSLVFIFIAWVVPVPPHYQTPGNQPGSMLK